MTDPKNHDDELGETTSSGEPEDADVEATDTDEATDSAADDADEMVDDVDEVDELDEEQDEERRKDKPAATGKASRSGNPARAAEAETTPRSTRPKPQKIGNRWAAPAMLASAGIGLLWIVLYYVFANRDNPIPLMSDLGDWNLIVGMGFIVAAFGFSMKWE